MKPFELTVILEDTFSKVLLLMWFTAVLPRTTELAFRSWKG